MTAAIVLAKSLVAWSAWQRTRDDPNPGIEQFWLVWSATYIEELDKAVGRWLNPTYKGDVHDPVQAAAIEQFLRSHLSSETIVDKNRQTRRTVVEGHGDVVVQLVEIEHR